MSCFICGDSAREIQSLGDWEERDCPGCGRYRISGTVLGLSSIKGRDLDVGIMRKYLADQRARNPDEVPLITTVVANL